MNKQISALVGLAFALIIQTVAQANTSISNLPTLAPVLKQTMPAIVNIAVQGTLPAIPDMRPEGDPESRQISCSRLPGQTP